MSPNVFQVGSTDLFLLWCTWFLRWCLLSCTRLPWFSWSSLLHRCFSCVPQTFLHLVHKISDCSVASHNCCSDVFPVWQTFPNCSTDVFQVAQTFSNCPTDIFRVAQTFSQFLWRLPSCTDLFPIPLTSSYLHRPFPTFLVQLIALWMFSMWPKSLPTFVYSSDFPLFFTPQVRQAFPNCAVVDC